ncbi:MAG: hypothetical protein P1P90_05665 [Patescibacteria group bacterium]|nr:hypothetical protein [Patescibacteria group bacterium]
MKKTLFLVFIFFVTIQAGCNVPESITVQKNSPTEVISGETFTFSVDIKNADNKDHELRSIDIDKTFLDGIMIVSTTPVTSEEYEVFGQHIFEFKSDIPANSTKEVIFNAKAIKSGDFSGDFDICIDGDASCLFNSIRILVN